MGGPVPGLDAARRSASLGAEPEAENGNGAADPVPGADDDSEPATSFSAEADGASDSSSGAGERRRRLQLRLAVGLPLLTAVLALGVGIYGYLHGRTVAADIFSDQIPPELLAGEDAAIEITARLLEAPGSYWWLAGLTGFGALVGLAVALAFTRQLRTLARRTEEMARRRLDRPVEMEADAEVQPLVSAINDLYRSVQEYARHSVADGIVSVDFDGRIVGLNTRAEVAMGVEAEDVLGKPFTELVPDVPQNERIRETIDRALRRRESFDLKGIVWVTPRKQRHRVDLQGTVLAGEEPILSVLVVFDKTTDLENIQRQVSRAHRLLLIGGFASELAHEIRNPLSSVLGLVDLLRDRLPEGDPGHRHLNVLERAAERIETLVKQLLELVPTEGHDVEPADLSAVVADTVSLVRASRGDDEVELHEEYETDLPTVGIDTERFSRAVDNLLRNALSHTPENGSVRVSTRATEDQQVALKVSNTGSYIPVEERERIFQPFVSGRPQGSGLGLAIAQQIVYAHGGIIEVESDETTGTSFIITLPPAADSDLDRSSQPAPDGERWEA